MNTPQDPAGSRLAPTSGSPSVVTCVYCGHEYPDGTPAAKHDLLTEHIKTCEKHPMRDAERTIADLRAQLDTERELRTLGDTYARRVADWIVGTGDGWPLASPYLEIRECIEGTRRQLDKQIAAHCSNKTLAENRAKAIDLLRAALAGLIGAENKEELEAMEVAMRIMPGIEADKIAGINAIHALLSVANS